MTRLTIQSDKKKFPCDLPSDIHGDSITFVQRHGLSSFEELVRRSLYVFEDYYRRIGGDELQLRNGRGEARRLQERQSSERERIRINLAIFQPWNQRVELIMKRERCTKVDIVRRELALVLDLEKALDHGDEVGYLEDKNLGELIMNYLLFSNYQ